MTAQPDLTEASACFDVFMARQPIFERDGRIAGYELLYRKSGNSQSATDATADVMAAEVLVQTFLNIGLDRVTGESRAYLNFTRDMLVQRTWSLFDPARVVIEILESVAPDAEVIAAVQALVDAGYTVALDDFVYTPAHEPLLDLVHVVKVDVLGRAFDEIAAVAGQLRGRSLMLLAERVETREVEAACRSMGFRLFQGYYYQRPELLSRRELAAGHVTILQLMNLLRNAESSDAQLEDAFRGDVSLTVKLLRTVNSASMGGQGIESIRHAVRMVGRGELHKWLSLLLVSSIAARGGTDVELVRTALTRAHLAELIGRRSGDRRGAESLFMVGLFSLLDALLRTPLSELLERIDLAPEIRRALLVRSGPYAGVLSLLEAWEQGRWDVVHAESDAIGMDPRQLGELYLVAVEWSKERLAAA
ncbi:MAG: HDOD domain-containing protein [Gemmatimonadaceae bacterium]|nr:HDOD domain-containing protein [Gemmatimonadaceae bacterium]